MRQRQQIAKRLQFTAVVAAVLLLSLQASHPVNAIIRYEGAGTDLVTTDTAFVTANTSVMPSFSALALYWNIAASNTNYFYVNYYGVHAAKGFTLTLYVPTTTPGNIVLSIASCPVGVLFSSSNLCADGSTAVTQAAIPSQAIAFSAPLDTGKWKQFWVTSSLPVFISINTSINSADLTSKTTNS